MIVVPYTFQCKELLFVLGRMLPPVAISEAGSVTEAAGQLANSLSRNVYVVDDSELLVELDEPVEAVAYAQQYELRIERCIASALALELLRESGGPARATWTWLRRSLKLLDDPVDGLVSIKGLAANRLPAGVDQIPDGPGVLVWVIEDDTIAFVNRTRTIGRHDSNDIPLLDRTVLPMHAAIVPHRGTWAIERRQAPLIVVDGASCSSRSLVPGQLIKLGDARLVILSVR